MTIDLSTINTAAADLIERVGWTQGTERASDGRVCLTGALRYCNPQPGNFHLAREVYRTLGHGEEWNDADTRTAADVVTYLREHPVTDDLLAATYGPQWQAIVAHVRRVAVLTDNEADALLATWDAARLAARDANRVAARVATWDAARDAARLAARDATPVAARVATWDAARDAAWDAARDATWVFARVAARDAAVALVVRDLLLATPTGTAHYKTLTRTWAQTIGPVHPDDEPVTT